MTNLRFEKDKQTELERYQTASKKALHTAAGCLTEGAVSMPDYLKEPYIAYQDALKSNIKDHHTVLELGAGEGRHSLVALQSAGKLVCTDLSQASLDVINLSCPQELRHKLETSCEDIEGLAFEDASFDAVISAGALSYGRSEKVMSEVNRLLADDGLFIAVDSWDHNPIYRFNRWLHYKKGLRTLSTLQNMPDRNLVRLMKQYFDVRVYYFGTISFLMPVLAKFLKPSFLAKLSRVFDKLFFRKQLAFKIVIIARKKQNQI